MSPSVPEIATIPLAPVAEVNFLEPYGILYAFESLWVPMDAQKKLQRIDPLTGKIEATITAKVPYEAENPRAINELVFVTSLTDGVSAFDPHTNASVYRFKASSADVVYGHDHY